MTAAQFRSEASPWLGTKLWQLHVITQLRGGCHADDRITHWLSHVIVTNDPGRGSQQRLFLDHSQAGYGTEEGGNALASLSLLSFWYPTLFFLIARRKVDAISGSIINGPSRLIELGATLSWTIRKTTVMLLRGLDIHSILQSIQTVVQS